MLYQRLQQLTKERHQSLSEVSTELGLGENSFYRFKNQRPNSATLEKIADYFDVSVDYLLGRSDIRNMKREVEKYEQFRKLSNEDVSEVLDFMLDQLSSDNPALLFDGEELDDETRELLISSLKNSYEMAKKLTKSD